MKITVLGCGTSGGVPFLGCRCPVCTSTDPRNRRTRVSVLVECNGVNILIDTSPDMRAQCLAHGVTRVDAILYTHSHADHLHGIDDVRSFNFIRDATLNAYGDAHTMKEITERFAYVFRPRNPDWGWHRPSLNAVTVTPGVPFFVEGVEVIPFAQRHGKGQTLGLRFGPFAYSTDTNGLDDAAFAALSGVEVWLVDCLRYRPAPSHSHLEMTLEWIKKVQPRQAYLTHMNHDFDYQTFAAELPAGVAPAYDGLTFEV